MSVCGRAGSCKQIPDVMEKRYTVSDVYHCLAECDSWFSAFRHKINVAFIFTYSDLNIVKHLSVTFDVMPRMPCFASLPIWHAASDE